MLKQKSSGKDKKEMEDFFQRFGFRKDGGRLVGVERECHLLDKNGKIAPLAPQVLSRLGVGRRFGYELSACQLEDRVGPCALVELKDELLKNEAVIKEAEKELGFSRSHAEVGPGDMPLDVYPDPTGRYREITRDMPAHILSSACRVIGTHVHIGMPDRKTALRAYNEAIAHFDELCAAGDGSGGGTSFDL